MRWHAPSRWQIKGPICRYRVLCIVEVRIGSYHRPLAAQLVCTALQCLLLTLGEFSRPIMPLPLLLVLSISRQSIPALSIPTGITIDYIVSFMRIDVVAESSVLAVLHGNLAIYPGNNLLRDPAAMMLEGADISMPTLYSYLKYDWMRISIIFVTLCSTL